MSWRAIIQLLMVLRDIARDLAIIVLGVLMLTNKLSQDDMNTYLSEYQSGLAEKVIPRRP